MEQALIQFYYQFHKNQHYFLCHDILEEAWKENNDYSKQDAVVSLILCATACYHYRRRNFKGAIKSFNKAKQVITYASRKDQMTLHLDIAMYIQLLEMQIDRVEQQLPFILIQLPINIQMLNQLELTFPDYYFMSTPVKNENIVHHHLLRDRSEVELARQAALEERHYKIKDINNKKDQ